MIGLHNLRVLLKANRGFDIPPRRAVIPGEHVFGSTIPEKDVELKIPAVMPNLLKEDYRHIWLFKDLPPSAAGVVRTVQLNCTERTMFFIPRLENVGKPCIMGLMCFNRKCNMSC